MEQDATTPAAAPPAAPRSKDRTAQAELRPTEVSAERGIMAGLRQRPLTAAAIPPTTPERLGTTPGRTTSHRRRTASPPSTIRAPPTTRAIPMSPAPRAHLRARLDCP